MSLSSICKYPFTPRVCNINGFNYQVEVVCVVHAYPIHNNSHSTLSILSVCHTTKEQWETTPLEDWTSVFNYNTSVILKLNIHVSPWLSKGKRFAQIWADPQVLPYNTLEKNVTYTSVHFNHLKIKHYLSLLSIKTIQNLTSIYLYECTHVLSAVGITQNVMF